MQKMSGCDSEEFAGEMIDRLSLDGSGTLLSVSWYLQYVSLKRVFGSAVTLTVWVIF